LEDFEFVLHETVAIWILRLAQLARAASEILTSVREQLMTPLKIPDLTLWND